MIKSTQGILSATEDTDTRQFVELVGKLPLREKERIFYMMQGIALMNDSVCESDACPEAVLETKE